MSRRLGLVLGALALSAMVAWSDPGNGHAYGKGHDKRDENDQERDKKHVAMPEPSPWAEMTVCALGLGLMAHQLVRKSRQ